MKEKRPVQPQPTESRLEVVRLGDVLPHPDQGLYFRSYGGYEFELLKADIKANGPLHPIMVLPPGNAAGLPAYTILAGHTRHKLLLELGHHATAALVRYDLRSATRADVDKLFLTDNVARRQQDRLGQARAAVRLTMRVGRSQETRHGQSDVLTTALFLPIKRHSSPRSATTRSRTPRGSCTPTCSTRSAET